MMKGHSTHHPFRAMKDASITRDERFADSYAASRLKHQYDSVVVDDSRGIGGFLWKFPSEGSNRGASSSRSSTLVFPLASSSLGASSPALKPLRAEAPSYPRKCDRCESAWFSDRKAERRHRKSCSGRTATTEQETTLGTGDSGGRSDGHGPRGANEAKSAAQLAVAKLGVARRVWCEVDSSLSQLQVSPSSRVIPTVGTHGLSLGDVH